MPRVLAAGRVAVVALLLRCAACELRRAGIQRLRDGAGNARPAPACALEFELCRDTKPANFSAMRDCLLDEHRAELSDGCVSYLELTAACSLPLLHELCPGADASQLDGCIRAIRSDASSPHKDQLPLVSEACLRKLTALSGKARNFEL